MTITIVLSIAAMLVLFSLLGFSLQQVLKLPVSLPASLMLGFVFALAVFQLLAYPLFCLNASFTLLFWLYSLLLIAFICLAVVTLRKAQQFQAVFSYFSDLFCDLRKEPILLLFPLGAVLLLTAVSLGYGHIDSDDSYYIPRVMEILSHNTLSISHGYAWSGLDNTSFPPTADVSTMEFWKAYWSHLFGLHPTIFCRLVLGPVVLIISTCSFYAAYRSVTSSRRSVLSGSIFITVFLLLCIIDSNYNSTSAYFSVRFPSHGKAILAFIIYPAIIFSCAKIVSLGQEPIPWQRWLTVSLVLLAGIASSIVGVYWAFICCVCMGAPYLLLVRWKDLLKLLPKLFLTCLPVLVFAIVVLFVVAGGETNYLSRTPSTWFRALYVATHYDWLPLFFLSLLVAVTFGNQTTRLVLCGGSLFLLLSFANPIFFQYVARYITTPSVYFRLFWILPTRFLPAAVIAELVHHISKRCSYRSFRAGAAALLLLLAVVTGKGMMRIGPLTYIRAIMNASVFTALVPESNTNPYYLSADDYRDVKQMLASKPENERVRIMWLSSQECFYRQYSNRFELLGACRLNQWLFFDQPINNSSITPLALQEQYSSEGRQDFEDPDYAHAVLLEMGVDFICCNVDSGFALRETVPNGFERLSVTPNVVVFRVIA